MSNKIDDLSESLDRINSGQDPQTMDRDTSDLLEVAELLRKSGLSVRPPEHIFSATVQRAREGLKIHKGSRRPNSWMFSGLLGAAAALLIFVGIHGFPTVQEVAPLVTPAPPSEPVASHGKALPESTPSTQNEQIRGVKKTSPESAQVNPDSPPTVLPPSSKTVSPPPSARPQSPAVSQESRPAQVPVPSQKTAPSEKSVLPPTAGQASRDTFIALRLPGRTPDSVVRDSSAGSIRQIFDSGTFRELIVTQRIKPQRENGAGLQSRQYVLRETDKGKSDGLNSLNKVVIMIHGQEVTLEGRQTVQELTELANSLYP